MTKRSIVSLLVLLFAAHGFADVGATDGFTRYKVIIDKCPFKKGAGAAPPKESQTIDSLSLNGFVAGDAMKKVWIKDNKTNKINYVGEGEMVLDYKVVSIDAETQTVILRKGITEERLAFPAKTTAAPVAANTGRPTYRGPTRPMTAAPNPVPAPAPAAVGAAAGGATPAPTSPTALRRRILRQQVKPVTPSGEGQPAEETKESDVDHDQQPASDATE